MKNILSKIVEMVLVLSMFTLAFTACGGEKITEEKIENQLADSDGTLDGILTIEKGSADDVKAFSYKVTDINADDLLDKSYTRSVVLISNSSQLYREQAQVHSAFVATMKVIGLFYESDNFDSDAFIEELLGITCDGNSKTYKGWTISATVDKSSDSITVKAEEKVK